LIQTFLTLISEHVRQFFFGIAGFALILFAVLVLLSGLTIKDVKAFFKKIFSKELVSATALEKMWQALKLKTILVLRFLGLMPQKPIFQQFRNAFLWLKESLDSSTYRYDLPFYLVVGEPGSGKTTLVEGLPLNQPGESQTILDQQEEPALAISFYNKAVFLDVSGACFLQEKSFGPYREWKTILKNLVFFRPQRPVNGVILTIPMHHFTGDLALTETDLRGRAYQVALQLRLIEKKTGLKLPLYIVITQTDYLAGFAGTANLVDKKSLKEVFGWSCPYMLQTLYSPKWIEEAFSDVYNQITRLSWQICASQDASLYTDDLMVLAPEFLKIQNKVALYITTLFQSPSYQEYFYLRGLYFTGFYDVETADLTALENTSISTFVQRPKKNLAFLGDLFLKKIIPEANIASPIRTFLINANNKINWMKGLIAFTLLGGLFALSLGKTHVSNQRNQLYEDLHHVKQAFYTLKLYDQSHAENFTQTSNLFFQEQIPHIFDLIQDYESKTLQTPWLPASYLFPMVHQLEDVIKISFYHIVRMALYKKLSHKADQLIIQSIPSIPELDTLNVLINPLETGQFLVLQGYVQAIDTLNNNMVLYNSLPETGDLEDFATVVAYTYDYTLHKVMNQNAKTFISSLLKGLEGPIKPFRLDDYKLPAQKRLKTLLFAFIDRVTSNKNHSFLENLQRLLNETDNPFGRLASLKDLQQALGLLTSVENILLNPAAAWISRHTFNPGNAFEETKAKIFNSPLFGKKFVEEILRSVATLYQRSQEDLKTYGSPLTGYFLTISPDTNMLMVSPGIRFLKKQLDDFLNQPFMQQPITDGTYQTTLPSNKLMLWDVPGISLAASLAEDYSTFFTKQADAIHPDLLESFKVLGESMLTQNVHNILARTQKIITINPEGLDSVQESYRQMYLNNLIEVSKPFLQLLNLLQAPNTQTLFLELKNLVFQQTLSGLKMMDHRFQVEGVYRTFYPDFSWWDGSPGAILGVYDVTDKADLKAFLLKQTQKLSIMAQTLASPLVTTLRLPVFDPDIEQTKLIDKWSNIINDLNDYKNSKSLATLANLQNFLLDGGNKITFNNCFTMIPLDALKQTSNNYFKEFQRDIQQKIRAQCQVLSKGHAIEKFNTLAAYFNQSLAGHFPFVQTVEKGTIPQDEVTPAALKTFFGIYDSLTAAEIEFLETTTTFENIDQVKIFLQQITGVKAFLNDYLMPTTPQGVPGIDFSIQFRDNQLHELYGNQVINWGFVAGSTTYEMNKGQNQGRWEYGQAAAFAFKWANQAPLKPIAASSESMAYTNVQNRAIFLYEGPWSLLRAIMLHQTPVANGGLPGDSSLLFFQVPLSSNPQNPQPETFAQVFVRLTPRAKGASAPATFTLPKFPSFAPNLRQNLLSNSGAL